MGEQLTHAKRDRHSQVLAECVRFEEGLTARPRAIRSDAYGSLKCG